MKDPAMEAEKILALSRLFAYPQICPDENDLKKAGMAKEVAQVEDGRGLEALQAEYVRLFINGLPETVCPPYGSFYLEGTLMGGSTVKLRDLYAGHGLHTDEMPDHIAVELEFLALLSMAPKHEGVGESLDFLLAHLRSWTPRFFEQIEINDKIGFFRNLSRSATGLLLGQENERKQCKFS